MAIEHTQCLTPGLAPRLPRAASLSVVVGTQLARLRHVLWLFLEGIGRRRANRDLLSLAERWRDINPTLARELRSYARGGSSY